MARGRKSEGAGNVLSIRIPDELRKRLQQGADVKGQSLNNEIRRRLERSFDEDQRINERFGDARTFAFFRLLHLTVEMLGTFGKSRRQFWLDDRYQYRQVASAIATIVEALEPSGARAPRGEAAPEGTGLVIAEHVVKGVKSAETPPPEELADVIESTFKPEVESGIHAALGRHLDRIPTDFFIQKLRQMVAGRTSDGR